VKTPKNVNSHLTAFFERVIFKISKDSVKIPLHTAFITFGNSKTKFLDMVSPYISKGGWIQSFEKKNPECLKT